MKKLFIIFVLISYFYACSQSVQKKVENKAEEKSLAREVLSTQHRISSIDDLVGIWANSKTDSLRLGNISLDEYFYPCTGFSISKFDKHGLKIYIQYSEQYGLQSFDDVRLKKGELIDTLIAIVANNKTQIIALIYPNNTIDLRLVEYNILDGKTPANEMKYFRILDKPCQGLFHNYILATIFKLLPINILIDNRKYLITQDSSNNCFSIPIKGYQDYTVLQIGDYKYDRRKRAQIFSLSFSDAKDKKNKFIEMQRDELGNILVVPQSSPTQK